MPRPKAASRFNNIAVVGAGMAGIVCARTLAQAGRGVTLFERAAGPGGRMATLETPMGSFDHGVQYFTVRDPRFRQALRTTPDAWQAWAPSSVRVLDTFGRVAAAGEPGAEPNYVAVPTMDALARRWCEPLTAAGNTRWQTLVTRIERDALRSDQWQLRTQGAGDSQRVFYGFDAVVLAMPAPQVTQLLTDSAVGGRTLKMIEPVRTAPCWTLMLAFPQASQFSPNGFGPQWSVARGNHHRLAWVARESSRPGRDSIERWTAQASPAWSQEHLEDDAPRVAGKLLKAFAEITGIRTEPAFMQAHRWRFAQTLQPLGQTHIWHADSGLGAAGDWCLGHRTEDAFISGLQLALAML